MSLDLRLQGSKISSDHKSIAISEGEKCVLTQKNIYDLVRARVITKGTTLSVSRYLLAVVRSNGEKPFYFFDADTFEVTTRRENRTFTNPINGEEVNVIHLFALDTLKITNENSEEKEAIGEFAHITVLGAHNFKEIATYLTAEKSVLSNSFQKSAIFQARIKVISQHIQIKNFFEAVLFFSRYVQKMSLDDIDEVLAELQKRHTLEYVLFLQELKKSNGHFCALAIREIVYDLFRKSYPLYGGKILLGTILKDLEQLPFEEINRFFARLRGAMDCSAYKHLLEELKEEKGFLQGYILREYLSMLFQERNYTTLVTLPTIPEELFDAVFTLSPNDPTTRLILANIYLQTFGYDVELRQKKFDQYLSFFDSMSLEDIEQILSVQKRVLFDSASYDALIEVRRAIALFPKQITKKCAASLYMFAICKNRLQSRNEEAVRILQEHLRNDPQNLLILTKLGTFLRMQCRFKEAKSYLQQAVYANPNNFIARIELGVIAGTVDEDIQTALELIGPIFTEEGMRFIDQVHEFLHSDMQRYAYQFYQLLQIKKGTFDTKSVSLTFLAGLILNKISQQHMIGSGISQSDKRNEDVADNLLGQALQIDPHNHIAVLLKHGLLSPGTVEKMQQLLVIPRV